MEAIQEMENVVGSNWNKEEKRANLEKKLQKLMSIKNDINIQLEDAVSRFNHKWRSEVENWLLGVERVENEVQSLEAEMGEARWRDSWGRVVERLSGEVDELIGESRFERGLVLELYETMGDALQTANLVGEAFQVNLNKICNWLMKDEVSRIGIYGVGGVGKTTLVENIYKKLLESPNTFHIHNVYLITISHDFNVYELQDHVAKVTHIRLSNKDDEKKRAAKLSEDLAMGSNSVFILDDLWNQLNLEEVGIPIHASGCKLILTTRSLDICRSICCQEVIKLDPLSEETSWELFVEKLGNYATVSSEVKMMTKSFARECAGVPLGIVTLAGSMRGVDDLGEWTNVLEELKESNVAQGETEDNVLQIIKHSYAQLKDPALQQCFLYCALFPEDFRIRRTDLIDYLIVEGVIKGFESRKAQVAKGHTLLQKLENVCLLESCTNDYYDTCVRMHDLVRDVALNMLIETSTEMVQAGKLLREIPVQSEWTEDLERVSLIGNHIKEIPPGHSPPCPNLSTLLLCHNKLLESIGDSFFKQLHGLKILDLSYTAVKLLPDPISNLVSLTCLMLNNCDQLWYIPSLGRLTTLKKLDLSRTGVEMVPQGLEFLSDLRYLDMEGTKFEVLPSGILPMLSCLQYLRVDWSLTVEGEVGCLSKLEHLFCRFNDPQDFCTYACHGLPAMDYYNRQLLSDCELVVGEYDDYLSIVIIHEDDWESLTKRVVFNECNVGAEGDFVKIPKETEGLFIVNCHDARSLCNASLVEDSTNPEFLRVCGCEVLECLISVSSSTSIFNNVERLVLHDLKNFQFLIHIDGAPPSAFLLNGAFSCLKCLQIWDCPSIKSLFPMALLPELQNLETIAVSGCETMEDIIGLEGGQEAEAIMGQASSSGICSAVTSTAEFSLPKLRFLNLSRLPVLKSIFNGKLFCHSIEDITLWDCPELHRLTISLVQPDNGGRPSPLPSLKKIRMISEELWDSLEWDHPNTKAVLQPLFTCQRGW